MTKFLVLLLILSIVFSVATFLAPFLYPDVMEPFMCSNGETLERTETNFSDFRGSGTNLNFYCVDAEGVSRDVTGKIIIPIIAFACMIPLLIILIVVRVVTRTVRRTVGPLMQATDLAGIQDQLQNYANRQSGASVMSASSSSPISGMKTDVEDDDVSLTDKLKQLQQAYTMGLISEAEFEKRKKSLLDKLTGGG
jgi:hypothetical protein